MNKARYKGPSKRMQALAELIEPVEVMVKRHDPAGVDQPLIYLDDGAYEFREIETAHDEIELLSQGWRRAPHNDATRLMLAEARRAYKDRQEIS